MACKGSRVLRQTSRWARKAATMMSRVVAWKGNVIRGNSLCNPLRSCCGDHLQGRVAPIQPWLQKGNRGIGFNHKVAQQIQAKQQVIVKSMSKWQSCHQLCHQLYQLCCQFYIRHVCEP